MGTSLGATCVPRSPAAFPVWFFFPGNLLSRRWCQNRSGLAASAAAEATTPAEGCPQGDAPSQPAPPILWMNLGMGKSRAGATASPLCGEAPGSVTFLVPEPQETSPAGLCVPRRGHHGLGVLPATVTALSPPPRIPFPAASLPLFPSPAVAWRLGMVRMEEEVVVASPRGPRCWAAPVGSKILVPKPASVCKAMDVPAGHCGSRSCSLGCSVTSPISGHIREFPWARTGR